jgi:hypothetical protein
MKVATISSTPPNLSHHAQQAITKPSERRRLSFQTIDLGVHRSQYAAGGISAADLSELVFQKFGSVSDKTLPIRCSCWRAAMKSPAIVIG